MCGRSGSFMWNMRLLCNNRITATVWVENGQTNCCPDLNLSYFLKRRFLKKKKKKKTFPHSVKNEESQINRPLLYILFSCVLTLSQKNLVLLHFIWSLLLAKLAEQIFHQQWWLFSNDIKNFPDPTLWPPFHCFDRDSGIRTRTSVCNNRS